MARKVFISDEMGFDDALAAIHEEPGGQTIPLYWPWLLTAFDDFGRGDASAGRIASRTFGRLRSVTAAEVEEALLRYAAHGLLQLYEINGRRYMAIDPIKWYRYQTHIRAEKRALADTTNGSRYPAPPTFPAPAAPPAFPAPAIVSVAASTPPASEVPVDAPAAASVSATRSANGASRYAAFIDLVRAADLPYTSTPADAKALKETVLTPDQVAELYVAIAKHQFGDKWQREHLCVRTAIGTWNAYATQGTQGTQDGPLAATGTARGVEANLVLLRRQGQIDARGVFTNADK